MTLDELLKSRVAMLRKALSFLIRETCFIRCLRVQQASPHRLYTNQYNRLIVLTCCSLDVVRALLCAAIVCRIISVARSSTRASCTFFQINSSCNDSARAGDELRELVVKTGMSVKNVSKALATWRLCGRCLTTLARRPAGSHRTAVSLATAIVLSNDSPLRTVKARRPYAYRPDRS
ncbi:hypothetical protein EVAR_88969_1 [Eumeta japonica]|uniref:Uncharacterized protein n=1 Tax=Eumeta variegata TaxID=151549 RepID=A0A4C1VP72_EUMVA|nr:hypothetical protein EVAR_88969_1 [Eumeta japonica]